MSLRPRFSLRTLLVLMFLIASGGLLYKNWYPWRVIHVLQGEKQPFETYSFSNDGRLLLASRNGIDTGTFYLWDVASGRLITHVDLNFGLVACIRFTDSSAFVVAQRSNYRPIEKVFDAHTGENILRDIDPIVGHIDLSAGEQLLCVRFKDGKRAPEIWDTASRSKLISLRVNALDSLGTLIHLDGETAVFHEQSQYLTFDLRSGGLSKVSTVVDEKYQPRLTSDDEHLRSIRMSVPVCITVSADRKRLLACDPIARIHDVDTGKVLATLQYPQATPADKAAGTPDLNYAATPGGNGTVLLWKRFRDEHLSSLLTLPEFWSTAVLLLGLLLSIAADIRSLRRILDNRSAMGLVHSNE